MLETLIQILIYVYQLMLYMSCHFYIIKCLKHYRVN